jgi:hypothetical protein
MPFTPYHMGPGILIKALLQGSFSLLVFGWTQVLIDLQPLIVMITRRGTVHGFSHTYLGATLIALVAAVTGKYLVRVGLLLLDREEVRKIHIGWSVALVSAFIGSYSHVFLDSIMHRDMAPMSPLSNSNRLLGIIAVSALHHACVYSALAGTFLYLAIRHVRVRRSWQ